jgi:hypothetical protein
MSDRTIFGDCLEIGRGNHMDIELLRDKKTICFTISDSCEQLDINLDKDDLEELIELFSEWKKELSESKDEPKQEPLQEDRWQDKWFCSEEPTDYLVTRLSSYFNRLMVSLEIENSKYLVFTKQQVLEMVERFKEYAEEME